MARFWWVAGYSCLLLVRRGANIWNTDFLAIPDISSRPCERPELHRLQDLPQDIQSSAANRFWVGRTAAEREDQGEHTTRHRPLEFGAGEYCSAILASACWAAGHCSGPETEAH